MKQGVSIGNQIYMSFYLKTETRARRKLFGYSIAFKDALQLCKRIINIKAMRLHLLETKYITRVRASEATEEKNW